MDLLVVPSEEKHQLCHFHQCGVWDAGKQYLLLLPCNVNVYSNSKERNVGAERKQQHEAAVHQHWPLGSSFWFLVHGNILEWVAVFKFLNIFGVCFLLMTMMTSRSR
jgi:hypothetical protein